MCILSGRVPRWTLERLKPLLPDRVLYFANLRSVERYELMALNVYVLVYVKSIDKWLVSVAMSGRYNSSTACIKVYDSMIGYF